METNHCKKNVFLYKLYVVFNEPLFWGPILIISIQKLAGMSLSDIYYMESVTLILCVLLDVPFGALADIIGRKKTIILGGIFLFSSKIFFATMNCPLDAWIANMLWAIGLTLQSGSDTSLLYDSLKECNREKEYKSIEGKAVGLRFFLVAICALTTGFLAKINLRFPLYLSVPFLLLSLIPAFFLHEPIHTEKYSIKKQFDTLKRGFLSFFKTKEVAFMIGFSTLIATISKIWFFTYNPYFEIVKIDVSYYGFIFFLCNMVAFISSHYAYKLEKNIGERYFILIMILCIGLPLIVMGLLPIAICAYLVLAQNLVRGFMKPFIGDYLHKHVNTDIRATTMSVNSTMYHFVSIITLGVFSVLLKSVNLLHALILLGITTLLFGFILYFIYIKKIE